MNAIYGEIAKTLKYPEQARKMGIEGRVFIQFIVNKDGSASDFTVLRGIGAGCDAEALKAAENAMKKYSWTAGIHNGNNVRVQMVLPISFKLSD